jgi:hypothetical protein
LRDDHAVDDLVSLNGRWPDWAVSRWDGDTLVLIADLDLTYHHAVEVSLSEVQFLATSDSFSFPEFRAVTEAERARVVGMFGPDLPPTLIAWDAETHSGSGSFLVACAAVTFVEGQYDHGPDD